MKKLISILFLFLAMGRKTNHYISIIEVYDGRDIEVISHWIVVKEGNTKYVIGDMFLREIYKDPEIISGNYRLWEDGNRVKKGKLVGVK